MMTALSPESRNAMSNEMSQKVLIVGAGPVGLVTAALLVDGGNSDRS